MYRVNLLPSAWEDLKHIEDWYTVQLGVKAALKVTDNILDAISRLEQFPDSGSLTPDEYLNEEGYRMIVCEKQVAIYKVVEKAVYVYHIADTRTEYTKLFPNI